MKLQFMNHDGNVIGQVELDDIAPHMFRIIDDDGEIVPNVKSVKLPKLDIKKPKASIVEIAYIHEK